MFKPSKLGILLTIVLTFIFHAAFSDSLIEYFTNPPDVLTAGAYNLYLTVLFFVLVFSYFLSSFIASVIRNHVSVENNKYASFLELTKEKFVVFIFVYLAISFALGLPMIFLPTMISSTKYIFMSPTFLPALICIILISYLLSCLIFKLFRHNKESV